MDVSQGHSGYLGLKYSLTMEINPPETKKKYKENTALPPVGAPYSFHPFLFGLSRVKMMIFWRGLVKKVK